MFKINLVCIAFFFLISFCKSEVFVPGNCRDKNVNVVKNFDISAYLGLWYEIRRYDNLFQSGECATTNYSVRNGTTFTVQNSEKLRNNTLSRIEGYAYLDNPNLGEGNLRVVLPTRNFAVLYSVVDTDYTGYSVVWSCDSLMTYRREYLWILSRTRTLGDEQAAKIQKVLNDNGIGENGFLTTNPEVC